MFVPIPVPQANFPSGIVPDSPAADADIRPGDIITKIAFQEVTDRESFRALILEHAEAGQPLLIQIYRNSSEVEDKILTVPSDYEAN